MPGKPGHEKTLTKIFKNLVIKELTQGLVGVSITRLEIYTGNIACFFLDASAKDWQVDLSDV